MEAKTLWIFCLVFFFIGEYGKGQMFIGYEMIQNLTL